MPREPIDFSEARRNMGRFEELEKELRTLRLTDPDSPRIEALTRQMKEALDASQKDIERVSKRVEEASTVLERARSTNFDVQRQMTTLSATLVVALLALSEVFSGAEGLREAVRDSSASLIRAVVYSVMAMVLYVLTSLEDAILPVPRSESFARWLGSGIIQYTVRLSIPVGIVFTVLSFWYFVDGLLNLGSVCKS